MTKIIDKNYAKSLIGAELDAAVAMCIGKNHHIIDGKCYLILAEDVLFNPSENCFIAGQFIKDNLIHVLPVSKCDPEKKWSGFISGMPKIQFGPTPLIAAMRAYVSWKVQQSINNIGK